MLIFADAKHDLERIHAWYEAERPGLGGEFLIEFDALSRHLQELPLAHARVGPRTRRAFLGRFPYLVLYMMDAGRVVITAVFHRRRGPTIWSDRVREGATTELRPELAFALA